MFFHPQQGFTYRARVMLVWLTFLTIWWLYLWTLYPPALPARDDTVYATRAEADRAWDQYDQKLEAKGWIETQNCSITHKVRVGCYSYYNWLGEPVDLIFMGMDFNWSGTYDITVYQSHNDKYIDLIAKRTILLGGLIISVECSLFWLISGWLRWRRSR